MQVRAKKGLGQHFLKDQNIAQKIVDSLSIEDGDNVLEIGPGTGVLTKFLLEKPITLKLIEIDKESIQYLNEKYPEFKDKIIEADFLKYDLTTIFPTNFKIIGNFPYYISSQILFKVLEHKNQVSEIVCMLQKEVASRLASPPHSKEYGILSVLLQAYYDITYLFTVDENVFIPPPKVKSAVISVKRNDRMHLDCDEILFKRVVKATFNQRRKTIRNSLKSVSFHFEVNNILLTKRPEQLSVEEFVELTNFVEQHHIS